ADKWMGKRFNSPNDLTIDLKGRIYFTDPRYVGNEKREIETESVYRLDPPNLLLPKKGEDNENPPVKKAGQGGWTVTQIISDVQKPNGIIISPDMKTLYLADSPGDAKGKRLLLS